MQTTTHLLKLAKQGEADAHFQLGYRMAFGREYAKLRPWKQIFTFWKRAANNGHIRAMFYLGTCYDHGYGIRKNTPLSFDCFFKAAEAGHRNSQL